MKTYCIGPDVSKKFIAIILSKIIYITCKNIAIEEIVFVNLR